MAEEQKPVEVAETAPAAEPAVETAPALAETAPAEEAKKEEPKAEEAAPAAEGAEAAPAEGAKEEPKKEEVKPIEEGLLEHKGAPAAFPKNLMYSKQFFWFGTEAVPKDKLATYLRTEKATAVAHEVASWASETGKGLLFYGKGDKTAVTGAIYLADASEPATEGLNKFSFATKGHKHAFKAHNLAERDNWVSQLKLKIAEAKELAPTVTESETYKNTAESFKPAKKEEAPAAPAAGPATSEATATAAPAEAPKEEAKKDEAKEEAKEEPKRRSASRKRQSIFGSLLGGGKKEEPKKEEKKEDKPAEEAAAAEPAAETPAEGATEAPAEGADKPAEEAKKEEPRPAANKRTSIFGGLSFGKKKHEEAPATPAKDDIPAVAENAPVIPAPEATEPLSAEVASPATVPTETTEAAPATNGETKKEVKSEKRKSSLPFAFGKKDKSDGEEHEKKESAFSKFRKTVKGKGKADKPAEKAEEAKAEDKPAETTEAGTAEAAAEPAATEEAAKPAEDKPEEPKPAEPAAAPAVTAAA